MKRPINRPIRDVLKPGVKSLPSSGPLSMSQIQGEFGGSNPISLSEYYGADSGVPSSGTISIGDFYGKSDAQPPFTLTSWGTLASSNWVITQTKLISGGTQSGVANSGRMIRVSAQPTGTSWTKSAAYTFKATGIFSAIPEIGPEHAGMRLRGPARFGINGDSWESMTGYLSGPASQSLAGTWSAGLIQASVNTNFLISSASGGTLTTATIEVKHTRGNGCQATCYAFMELDANAALFTVS